MNIVKFAKINLARPLNQRVNVSAIVADIQERTAKDENGESVAGFRGKMVALHAKIHAEAQATLAGVKTWEQTFSNRYRATA